MSGSQGGRTMGALAAQTQSLGAVPSTFEGFPTEDTDMAGKVLYVGTI